MSNILNKYVSKIDKIAYRTIVDEVVVMTPDDSMLHTLNSIGSDIFSNINGKKSVKEICDIIYKDYDATEEKIAKDVSKFISELVKKNILSLSYAPVT